VCDSNTPILTQWNELTLILILKRFHWRHLSSVIRPRHDPIEEALKQNKSITTLHLGNNAIGDEGTKHLADALSCNDSLTDLYLKGNKVGDVGLAALAEAMHTNMVLSNIDLIGDNASKTASFDVPW